MYSDTLLCGYGSRCGTGSRRQKIGRKEILDFVFVTFQSINIEKTNLKFKIKKFISVFSTFLANFWRFLTPGSWIHITVFSCQYQPHTNTKSVFLFRETNDVDK